MIKTKKPRIRFGIKPKLFLYMLTIIAAIILVISWQIDVQSHKVAQRSVQQSLEQSQRILQTKLQSRFQAIKETAVSLSRDGRILPLVFDKDSATLQDLTLEFKKALDFNSLMLTDENGYILARSDRPAAIGFNMSGRSYLFDEPLRGNVSQGFVVSNKQIMQLVAAPVFDNVAKDVVRGSIALTYPLSSEMAVDINALTASHVNFYVFTYDSDRKINGVSNSYSTRKDLLPEFEQYFANKDNWQALTTITKPTSNNVLRFNQETFRAVIHPITRPNGNNLGFIVSYRSETELLKPFNQIKHIVLIVGGICLVLSLLLALIMAFRITRPITELLSMTEEIENGELPTKPSRRGDEIGVLSHALYRMGRSLKEKSELENYLAEFADNIDDEMKNFAQSSMQKLSDELTAETQISNEYTLQTTMASSNHGTPSIIGELNKNGEAEAPSDIDPRYEIIRLLGKGATGQVYLAHDSSLDEDLAIKVLDSNYVSSDYASTFKEEIRLARQITHRNILRTFDFGTTQSGIFYITMEYVNGYDLSKLLKVKGRLSPNLANIMVKQICSALVSAHELGIIHRDLKPENMMITQQGVLKIMDFGLAMRVSDSKNSGKNRTIAGTPSYMAPEQFFGDALDNRTDIYAVGIILFVLLTGKQPFHAKSFEAMATMHQQQQPPRISEIANDIPEGFQAILDKALAKDKQDRYDSIMDMLNDLNEVVLF